MYALRYVGSSQYPGQFVLRDDYSGGYPVEVEMANHATTWVNENDALSYAKAVRGFGPFELVEFDVRIKPTGQVIPVVAPEPPIDITFRVSSKSFADFARKHDMRWGREATPVDVQRWLVDNFNGALQVNSNGYFPAKLVSVAKADEAATL